MDDYIRRQDAVDELEERLRANGYSNVALATELERSIGYMKRIPSAPVREVKRGRWILSRGDSLNFIKCTNCQGLSAEPVAHTVYPWNYCPYCGADMREDGE